MTKKEKLLHFNNLLKELKENGGEWRIDKELTPVFEWLYIHDLTELNTVQNLCDLYDNDVNTEILNLSNITEYNFKDIESATGHSITFLKRQLKDNKKGYLFHYPTIKNGRCYIESSTLFCNLHDLEIKKPVYKTVLIYGAKWFDKVNGNTYNNAKIDLSFINPSANLIYCGYTYGYGDYWKYRAEKIFNELKPKRLKNYKLVYIDLGYIKKSDLKNNYF